MRGSLLRHPALSPVSAESPAGGRPLSPPRPDTVAPTVTCVGGVSCSLNVSVAFGVRWSCWKEPEGNLLRPEESGQACLDVMVNRVFSSSRPSALSHGDRRGSMTSLIQAVGLGTLNEAGMNRKFPLKNVLRIFYYEIHKNNTKYAPVHSSGVIDASVFRVSFILTH